MLLSITLASFLACNGQTKDTDSSDSGIIEPSSEARWTGEFLLVHGEGNVATEEYTTVYGVFVDSQPPYWRNSLCMFFQI